jgi:hypothetical protein
MSEAATHHCTCPATIAAENHKCKTEKWWQDSEYRERSEMFLKQNRTCAYCGKKATLVHHDKKSSYYSREEYFNPANFTACCMRCHQEYRKGDRVICPVCRQHYMKRDAEKCRWCVGIKDPGRKTRLKPRHPCTHSIGQQRCQRDGRLYVCSRSPKTADGCDHFRKREAVPS